MQLKDAGSPWRAEICLKAIGHIMGRENPNRGEAILFFTDWLHDLRDEESEDLKNQIRNQVNLLIWLFVAHGFGVEGLDDDGVPEHFFMEALNKVYSAAPAPPAEA